jgi:hypothetical protein
MKRLLLFLVPGLVVVAISLNWHATRQIRDQLDRTAQSVSMFGTLSYDSVRLSPGGAVNINDLSFRLHQGRGGIDIGRISVQTANLLALFALEGKLERGQLPESLGLSLEGIRFPLDGALATMARDAGGGASPADNSAFLFAAEGCGERTQFSANDLMHMDYFDIRADVDAHYRFIDDGERLRVSISARTQNASAIYLEANFDLLSGTLHARDVARSMQNARLGAFLLEYEDLGYYERMLGFCAEEMQMTRAEYIAHHLQAWTEAWSRAEARPGPDLVAAYEAFLKDPQQFRINSNAEDSVSLEGIDHYEVSDLLERMDVRLVVNHGDPQPLDVAGLDESPARIAASDQSADTDLDVPTASPGSDRATVPASNPTNGAGGTDAEATTTEVSSGWITVDPGELGAYRNPRLRVVLDSGDDYTGRLSRVDDDNIHIRVRGVGGFYVRPIPRSRIRELEVYEDS